MCELYNATVPGSMMLFGEHAVLQGHLAIVCAIDKYITVTLKPRSDQMVNITAPQIGNHSVNLKSCTVVPPFTFVLATIQRKLQHISCGFDLTIHSEFSAQVGLGSSAAVTVAVLAVLEQWAQKQQPAPMQLLTDAKNIIHQVQGVGSGADAAASIFGGIIAYQMSPAKVERVGLDLPLAVIYSGSKMPTKDVINFVAQQREQRGEVFDCIYNAIDKCSKNAVSAIKEKNWKRLGELMNIHQGLQEEMGVCNKVLAELVLSLREYATIYGAKISGSGLGDCVIGLGNIGDKDFPQNENQAALGVQQLDVHVSPIGLQCN